MNGTVFVRQQTGVESHNHEPEAMRAINIDETTAKGKDILGAGGIEVDKDDVMGSDRVLQERFMQDVLEVHFHEAADENEPQFVEVTVNGEYRRAVRGFPASLKRMHVAVLAQAKQLRVTQKKVVNADGSMGFIEQPVMKLTYPFSIISDPSPRGAAWLKKLLQSPA